MPPTVQTDAGAVKTVSGSPGSVALTPIDEHGNVKVQVDNNTFPAYLGLQLTGLTQAPSLLQCDASRNIVSVTDLSTWVKGTTNKITATNAAGVITITIASGYVGQASITTLGTIGTGTWQGSTIGVGYGGTGQTSYTDGQLLIGNSTGNTLAKATLTGTANQVVVTNGGGSITLSTPQDINTSSSPTFVNETLTGNLSLTTVGKTIKIKEGSNACKGSASLSGGTATVNTTAVKTGDLVIITPQGITAGGNLGVTITDGTSFQVDSTNVLDGRTFDWAIIKAS